jgi:thiol-disulfide isomerase/thioredoxin
MLGWSTFLSSWMVRHVVDARSYARRRLVIVLGSILMGCTPAADSGRQVAPARPQLIAGPQSGDDLAGACAAELEKAHVQHATLVVYVGAPWCEPCRRFHRALAAGELDATFPDVRFLEFDYDKSHDALTKAGYVSTLIPLFAIPKRDGTASERRIEGSIKGPSAVAENLVPRLKVLLAAEPSAR